MIEADEIFLTLGEVVAYTKRNPATIRRHKSHLRTSGSGRGQRVSLINFNRFLARVYPLLPLLTPEGLVTFRQSFKSQWMECTLYTQTAHLVANGSTACGAKIPQFAQWLPATSDQPKCKRCLNKA